MSLGFYMEGNMLSAGNAVGALENVSYSVADVIFPPLRPPKGGLGLFKAVKVRVSSNGTSPVDLTLSVYKKGNMPKDTSDAPDYSISTAVPNGNYIFNLPHIVTEELIIRLRFVVYNSYTDTIANELGGGNIRYLTSPKIRILQVWVEIEDYGDVGNVHEEEWRA